MLERPIEPCLQEDAKRPEKGIIECGMEDGNTVDKTLHSDIFIVNEQKANRYTAFCTLIAAVVAVLMWFLNLCGFFIVDQHLMNIAMPAGVALFLLPSLFIRICRGKPGC